ncbi:tetrapyrrole biosynthesis, uroporphyrinogen III synthase [Rhizodiscina lignyota]|uniref:Tetrapyrrole biosynthesis, uroporphyrinogen III synthase n=1 Tax=Rhizodiscina lignyota TaxID=1504668 RepID=A0A9P4ILV8_9PEZI|nr:tetrapyrrole biosynthesis, uroporphyrinogen III synthase [Rhizodiscina lignyota]
MIEHSAKPNIPVLLLKTKSTPHDGYHDYFSDTKNGQYEPIFVPVLEHRFNPNAMGQIRALVEYGRFKSCNQPLPSGRLEYGGLIFTSQRAVEAFSKVIREVKECNGLVGSNEPIGDFLSADVPFYVVGPATAKGLRALNLPCPILGEESGNGDALAAFILQHYNKWWPERQKAKLPLLFIAGEQRRDIIPKTLQSDELGEQRIEVDELPCYQTKEMLSFRSNFSSIYSSNGKRGVPSQWVVVFSPTGCGAMFDALGFLDSEDGRAKSQVYRAQNVYIATIGPTTRDHLKREFAFEPDVCSPKPNPESLGTNTRSTTRGDSSPASQNGAGTKRKAEPTSSPTTKRSKKTTIKKATPKKTSEQKTLEETMPEDLEMREADATTKEDDSTVKPANDAADAAEEKEEKSNAKEKAQAEEAPSEKELTRAKEDKNGAIEKSPEKKLPSNILEKGIIYFFTRGRVGIEEPTDVKDLQRSYLVLRPLPADAKLGDGVIPDLKNNRLIAIPKKALPKSHKDRFMVFVEKANTTMDDLKENFFQGSEYETKTAGVRHTPPVTSVGEGVYAFTIQGASTHLAYMLTIPSELGDVQNDLGIRAKGSFIVSLKNPERPGPANAQLPQGPDFPQEMIDKDFHGRAWIPPSRAEQLDYVNAQFLLIGEGETGFDKATEGVAKDKKHDTETPAEEIAELENEDEIRVEHLHGDDTVFDDLGISHKDYPKVLTTW